MRLLSLLSILFLLTSASAQEKTRSSLDRELNVLKEKNNLSDWLYKRISFSAEHPQNRLPFLMATQSEVWRQPKTIDEREAWLNLLVNQGYYQLYSGDILQSIECYEKAHAYYRQHPPENFDLIEYIFKPLGNNYTRLGDYTNALFIQKTSLHIARRNRDSLTVASLYSNLAVSYKSMGKLPEAERACMNGFSFLPSTNPLQGLLKSTLADIKFEQGNYERAGREIIPAITILSSNKHLAHTRYWLLSAYTLAGNIEQKKGNTTKALQFYKQGIGLIESDFQGSRRREKANLLIQICKVALTQGQPQKGLVSVQQALAILLPDFKNTSLESLPEVESLYSENRLSEALELRGKGLLMLGKEKEALNNFLLALSAGDKARREFADENDRHYYQSQSKKIAEQAINIAFNLWKKTKDKQYSTTILSISEQTKARTLLDQIEKNRRFLVNKKNPLLKKQAELKRAIIYYENEHLISKKPNISCLCSKKKSKRSIRRLKQRLLN
jgi:tetratricopeptide (TPR) repeat protein